MAEEEEGRRGGMQGFGGLTLDELAFLEALVRHRSLKEAARAFGLTRAAASRLHARLSVAAGSPLFIRSNPHLVPTAEAIRLADVVVRLRHAAQGLVRPAVQTPAEWKRTFRVAAGENAAYAFCLPVFEQLFRSAPGVDFVVESVGRAAMLARLKTDVDLEFYPVVALPP